MARKLKQLATVEHMLPDTMQLIRAAVGIDAATAFAAEFGGRTLYIPQAPCAGWHAIAEVIGEPATKALAAQLGGDELYIPSCAGAQRELRDRRIRAVFDKMTTGATRTSAAAAYAAISQSFHLSDRRIQEILGRADAGPGPEQLGLFDP